MAGDNFIEAVYWSFMGAKLVFDAYVTYCIVRTWHSVKRNRKNRK